MTPFCRYYRNENNETLVPHIGKALLMRRTLVNALSTVLLGAAFFAAASPVSEAQTSSRRQTRTATQTQSATNAGAYSRIKAFVDGDSFLVARLDLAQIDLKALDRTAMKIFVETLERQDFDANSIAAARREFNQTFNAFQKFAEPKLAQFRDEMGLREVYFVVPRANEPEWFVYAPLAKSKRAAVSLFAGTFAPSTPFEVGSGVAFGTAKFNAGYFERFQSAPNPKLEAFLAESNATLQVFIGEFNVAPAAALAGDDAAKAFAAKLADAPLETRSAVETFDTYFVDGRFELDVNALKTSARLDFASADAANKVRVGLEKLADVIGADVEKTLAEHATEGSAKYNAAPVVRELFRGFLANSLPKRDGASLTFDLQVGPTIPLTNPITGALLAASGPSAVEALASWRPDGALSALLAAFANRAERTDVAEAEAETERDVLTPYVEEFGFFVSKEQLAQEAEEARAAAQAEASFATPEDALRALSDATNGFLREYYKMPLRYTLVSDAELPGHSWRVHLLPFLGEETLYKKIKLDEPWDSEYNSQFHAQTPAVYRRAGAKLDPNETKACFYSCLADSNSALIPASSLVDKTGADPTVPSGRPGAILYYERPDAVCWMDPNADGDAAFLQKLRESENGVLTVRDGGFIQRFKATSSSIKSSASVAETAARQDEQFKANREFRNALTHFGNVLGYSYWFELNRAETSAEIQAKKNELQTKKNIRFKAPFMSVEATRNRHNIRFRHISHALGDFVQKNNALPARYSADETGKPLHSWRVHLLPYFPGQIYRNLYAKIRLDEPWDSEYNRQFHSQVPDAYREILSPKGTSTVVCVVDERGLFTKPTKPGSPLGAPVKGNFSDDPDVTLAVVESLKPVCWMDPNANMSFETFVASVAASRPDLEAICLGLTCEPFGIPSNADPALLGGLVTRDGDELIDTFAYPTNP